jgi:hypothetical protein
MSIQPVVRNTQGVFANQRSAERDSWWPVMSQARSMQETANNDVTYSDESPNLRRATIDANAVAAIWTGLFPLRGYRPGPIEITTAFVPDPNAIADDAIDFEIQASITPIGAAAFVAPVIVGDVFRVVFGDSNDGILVQMRRTLFPAPDFRDGDYLTIAVVATADLTGDGGPPATVVDFTGVYAQESVARGTREI